MYTYQLVNDITNPQR